MVTVQQQKPIVSGGKFPETGYYKYVGHVKKDSEGCFVPPQTNLMLFRAGDKVPKLGSCPHEIEWVLVSSY